VAELFKVNDMIASQSRLIDMTESEIKFFLTKLKDGDINDPKYRKLLINVFVQAIYLYDNKLTLIFNTSNHPVEIESKIITGAHPLP
jgi:hypothetical protein